MEPETVQVPETTAHVTAPPPEPPVAVNARSWPYVADVEETVRTACAVRFTVTVVLDEVTAV